MTTQDYSGVFDLTIGEVYGLRMWKMDHFGRLRARANMTAGPWRLGVNTAVCHKQSGTMDVRRIDDPSGQKRTAVDLQVEDLSGGFGYSFGGTPQIATRPMRYQVAWNDGQIETYNQISFLPPNDEDHPAPQETCGCGFYAYTDVRHEEIANYGGKHMILGVIKGTGRTLIGTRGFRCERAEIVALRNPTHDGTRRASWRLSQLAHLERNYPAIPLLSNRAALLNFAPIDSGLPGPDTEEFWKL